MNHILIVEDEVKLAQLQAEYLQSAGFEIKHLHKGDDVVPWFKANRTDLILLDLMLPGCDGLDICRQIRRISHVPIIIVTARIEEIDRLLGLELGADDYICKPYSLREMVARVKAVLRRQQTPAYPTQEYAVPIKLIPENLRVSARGQEIELTFVEFQLLQTMFLQPGRVFSRAKLMDLIYSDQRVVADRTIDSHIKKLRKKLSDLLPDQELVHSVYGAGYRYESVSNEFAIIDP